MIKLKLRNGGTIYIWFNHFPVIIKISNLSAVKPVLLVKLLLSSFTSTISQLIITFIYRQHNLRTSYIDASASLLNSKTAFSNHQNLVFNRISTFPFPTLIHVQWSLIVCLSKKRAVSVSRLRLPKDSVELTIFSCSVALFTRHRCDLITCLARTD